MRDIEIYVATHKPYRMPEDTIYVPLQVGAVGRAHFLPVTDDTGDHISEKNACFCELTGLYWAWKQSAAQVVGLAQYRRHFGQRKFSYDPWQRVLGRAGAETLLDTVKIILPRPQRYVIETNFTQYAHAHHAKDLTAARGCIDALCPQYLPEFDSVMKKTEGHRLNMMIMEKPVFDAYCEWLFSVLFMLEKQIDVSDYDPYNRRVFGFIGERLLDVWLKHQRIPFAEVPVVNIEAVRRFRKGYRFLKRKFSAR